MRAATWAGPTSAAAVMAAVLLAPAISRMRGRCAASAVLVIQVAAKASASSSIGRSKIGPLAPSAAGCDDGDAGAVYSPVAFGTMKRLIGRPISRCAPAQTQLAVRQPHSASITADSGQQTVLAKPARDRKSTRLNSSH